MMRHSSYIKNVVSQKSFLFVACGKFQCSLPQNYATLYLMICPKDFFNETHYYDGKEQIGKSNAMLSSFLKKFCFGANEQLRSFKVVEGNGRFCWGNFSCWVVRIWQVILTIWSFSKLKTTFCTYLKSKLAWLVSTKSIKLQWKWYGSYDLSLKWSFC